MNVPDDERDANLVKSDINDVRVVRAVEHQLCRSEILIRFCAVTTEA